ILLVLLLFGASFAGLSIEEYKVTKDVFKPGEPGVATVTVSNPTGAERITSITLSVQSPSELIVTSAPKLADIDAGGTAIISIPFKVAANAKPGIYTIHAFFTGYKSTGAVGNAQVSVNGVSIPVTVVNEPELSYSMGTTLLTGFDDVVLTITNNGGTAKNVKLSMPGNVSIYGADQVYIGDIKDSATVDLLLDSRDVEDGATNVLLFLTYNDEIGIAHTDDASLRMTVRNEKLDVSFTQKTDLMTRSESILTLEVKNNGDETIQDVRLNFDDDSLRLKDVSEFQFGDLAPGESATASALVYTELEPGLNLIPSTVEWLKKDVLSEESRNIALNVNSDAEVAVFLEAKPIPLTIGQEHTVSVLVSNLGSFPIENVDVSLSSPALRSLDISDVQYIGGLQRDDFSTVQFLMEANATETGSYPVYINVNYRDSSGEWKSETIKKNITIYGAVQSEGDPLPLIGLIVIVVVGVWYFKFRKK
ncbi:MAG: hypothetical protein ABH983_00170, partial [Candidatus Micrarchaeota archaeon]